VQGSGIVKKLGGSVKEGILAFPLPFSPQCFFSSSTIISHFFLRPIFIP
jgi:hypothetical protein